MTQVLVNGPQHQRAVEATGPITQTSTSSTVDVVGADIDARQWTTIAYTIIVATNAVTWSVWAGNAPDYSDEVAVLGAASVAAGSVSSYSATANYGYYRVQIVDTVGGTHGSATVNGLAK